MSNLCLISSSLRLFPFFSVKCINCLVNGLLRIPSEERSFMDSPFYESFFYLEINGLGENSSRKSMKSHAFPCLNKKNSKVSNYKIVQNSPEYVRYSDTTITLGLANVKMFGSACLEPTCVIIITSHLCSKFLNNSSPLFLFRNCEL